MPPSVLRPDFTSRIAVVLDHSAVNTDHDSRSGLRVVLLDVGNESPGWVWRPPVPMPPSAISQNVGLDEICLYMRAACVRTPSSPPTDTPADTRCRYPVGRRTGPQRSVLRGHRRSMLLLGTFPDFGVALANFNDADRIVGTQCLKAPQPAIASALVDPLSCVSSSHQPAAALRCVERNTAPKPPRGMEIRPCAC